MSEEVNDMTVGSKIFELRKKWKLSQEELAERVHVSRPTVSKWENDVVLPDVYNLKELAKVFQCTVDELIDDAKELKNEKKMNVNQDVVVESRKYSGGIIKRHWQKIGYLLVFVVLSWIAFGFIVAISTGSLKVGNKVYHFEHIYDNHVGHHGNEYIFDMGTAGFETMNRIQMLLWLVPLIIGLVLIIYDFIKMKGAK